MMRKSAVESLAVFNPVLLWSDLAFKTADMLVASAQVIGHRTGRMVVAGHCPSPHDLREFSRMGCEKVEAGAESATAWSLSLWNSGQQWTQNGLHQLSAMAGLLGTLLGSRTVEEALQGQTQAWQWSLTAGRKAWQLSGAMAEAGHRCLAPIRSRATANARRLGRRSLV